GTNREATSRTGLAGGALASTARWSSGIYEFNEQQLDRTTSHLSGSSADVERFRPESVWQIQIGLHEKRISRRSDQYHFRLSAYHAEWFGYVAMPAAGR